MQIGPQRKPSVFWFNPNCEAEVALGRQGTSPSRLVRLLGEDLSALPMFLGRDGDVVLVRRAPSRGFLERLAGLGFAVPEFVECGDDLKDHPIVARGAGELRPWGWSPESEGFLRRLLPEDAGVWNEGVRQLYSKAWSAGLLADFLRERSANWLCGSEVVGKGCDSLEEVRARIGELGREGVDGVLVKAIFASSGQQQMRVFGGVIDKRQSGWLRNVLGEQGEVVVEPLLEKVCDLSLHLDIAASGESAVVGWTRFFTDGRGQYRGTFVRGAFDGLDEEVRGFLGDGERVEPRFEELFGELAAFVVGRVAGSGYAGPVGIDMLIYRAREGLKFKPVVEVNPRYTMGRVALRLSERVKEGRTGVWLMLSEREIRTSGFADVAEFAGDLEGRFPPVLTEGAIDGGIAFTTDPAQARAFATLLLVGDSLAECRGYFAGLKGRIGEWGE